MTGAQLVMFIPEMVLEALLRVHTDLPLYSILSKKKYSNGNSRNMMSSAVSGSKPIQTCN
jgi:hypothetical protein